jgi:hypothetical protein
MMLSFSLQRRFSVGCLIGALLLAQIGCDLPARLRKPITDFADATNVVTTQARLVYGELNRIERIRSIKRSRRLKERLNLQQLRKDAELIRSEELLARFDALDHLDQYARLLSDIVNSDVTDRIANSANNLNTELKGLVVRIHKLNENSSPDTPAGDTTNTSEAKPNNGNFIKKFDAFSKIAQVVLDFIVKKKRDDALKNAIKDGDAPVNDLIEAVKSDLGVVFKVRRRNLDSNLVEIFQKYNEEISSTQPNQAKLDDLEQEVISSLEVEEVFYATDPTEALDKMKIAHSKMVNYANQPTNETEVLASIQSFVEAATRLGAAIVKLKAKDKQNS